MNCNQEVELVFLSDTEEEIERKLTIYKYKTEDYINIIYFVGYEITTLLGYKDTNRVIRNNVSKCNQLTFKKFQGDKNPKLDARTILLLSEGVAELLIKTRKRITPDVLQLFKEFGIETTNKKCLTKEQQTLSHIATAFKTEKFEDQYKVGKYYLDMYFNEYNMVIECDELGHNDRKPGDERERMDFVNNELGITDLNWIRYNPDEYDFDIIKVIGRIRRKIDEIKEEKYKKEREEEIEKINKQKEEEIERLKQKNLNKQDEIEWELQIEPITCKFTAPPKDILIKMLKTKNISDIAKMYQISTNPVAKWLKQHEINIKDYHNYNSPLEKDLLEQCKNRTQTEVAEHYNVSNHIIRKWLSNYGLCFQTIKKQERKVNKKELLKAVKEVENKEEICNKLEVTEQNLNKLIKTHNINTIPNKEDLEKILHEKSKEDIAIFYKTTRTTLRKWIKLYELEHIRYTKNTHRAIKAIKNGEEICYKSVKELCKDLHIGHNKVDEYVGTGNSYNEYIFEYIENF